MSSLGAHVCTVMNEPGWWHDRSQIANHKTLRWWAKRNWKHRRRVCLRTYRPVGMDAAEARRRSERITAKLKRGI